jgi:hypothetical protein
MYTKRRRRDIYCTVCRDAVESFKQTSCSSSHPYTSSNNMHDVRSGCCSELANYFHANYNSMRDMGQHLVIDVRRAIEGFVSHGDVPQGPSMFYGDLGDATEAAKNVVYVLQTIVGDSIVASSLVLLF